MNSQRKIHTGLGKAGDVVEHVVQPAKNADELYAEYAKWTGLLHHWAIKHLGEELNVEFFPGPAWEMKLYPGPLEERSLQPWGFSTVPAFERPKSGRTVPLPRPEENPTEEQLQDAFRALCLAAAQALKIDLRKARLQNGTRRATS